MWPAAPADSVRADAMADELRQAALRLLARRDHTRAELARKLAALGPAGEVDSLIAELQAAGLQSDRRFAENYVRGRADRFGAARLRQALREKGVAGELIDAQLAPGGLPDEIERARAVWRRKFAAAPVDPHEWARQARFLQGRGFSGEIIRRLLKRPDDNDDR